MLYIVREKLETSIHNLLTVKETAEYLRIPFPTVYYFVQRGKIPAIQIGGRWQIKKSFPKRQLAACQTLL
jgi:excisionase family DNA binding protein